MYRDRLHGAYLLSQPAVRFPTMYDAMRTAGHDR